MLALLFQNSQHNRMRDGRPLCRSKLRSYFSPFVDQSTPGYATVWL